MAIDRIAIRREAKRMVCRQSLSQNNTTTTSTSMNTNESTTNNISKQELKKRKNNDTNGGTECILAIDRIAIRREAKMMVQHQLLSQNNTTTTSTNTKKNVSTTNNISKQELKKRKNNDTNGMNERAENESDNFQVCRIRHQSKHTSTNKRKRRGLNSEYPLNVINPGNIATNKDRQSILDVKMKTVSNKRITRQKVKALTNECMNLSEREIRAIRRAKQYNTITNTPSITTTPTNVDDTSSYTVETTTKPKRTNVSVNVVTIKDNSSNKKQLSERTLRAFRRTQSQKAKDDVCKNNNNAEENHMNDDTRSLQASSIDKDHDATIETIETEQFAIPCSRTRRAASANAALNIKKMTNIENFEDFDNLSELSIGEVPTIPPPGNIFDDILHNDDKDGLSDDGLRIDTLYDDHSSNNSFKSTPSSTYTNLTNPEIRSQRNRSRSCTSNGQIRDINDIIHLFKLPKTIKSSLPKKKHRSSHADIESINARGWKGMVNLTTMCCKQIIDIICPGPSRVHLREHMIRYLLSEKTSRHSENKTDYKQKYDYLVKSLFDALKVSKKGSVQKRMIRAMLVNGIQTQHELRSCCLANGHANIANGHNKSQALMDLKKLMNPHEDLVTPKFSRKRTKDEAIEHAVKFILSSDNIKTTSWGSIDKLITPTETIVLPKIQRITTRKIMWESYSDSFRTESDRDKPSVGRTSFLLLCKELTSCDELVLSSVDYVQALLLTEPIDLLQDITDKIKVPSVSSKITLYLQSLSNFLKYQYPKHVQKDDSSDSCCTHGLQFSLGRKGSNYDALKETKDTGDISCHACRFYSFVCNTLKSKLIDEHYFPQSDTEMVKDAVEACNDCEIKLQMYMAHQVRCTNQNVSLKKIEENMIDKLKESDGQHVQCLMIADFKMKFEPMSSRETTLGHYGKRGIGWHGIHLMYYRLEEHDDDDGNTQKVPVKCAVYLDQIMADSNKQDCLCVFSMLDAALQQIKINLPFITELILQSDNANCYQNNFIVCSIGLLNACHEKRGLRVIQFVHTETQDGKTVLDAHFATCMRFLTHFMRTWYKNRVTKINTPKGLGYALAWKGGIPNVMVQVVKMNRPHVTKIFETFQPIINQLKKYFSRVNMKHFLGSSTVNTGIENVLEQIKTMKFEVGIQSYSNIDQISTFVIDMNTNKVYPSKYVQNEMHFLLKGERLHADCQHEDDEYMNAARGFRPVANDDGMVPDEDVSGINFNGSTTSKEEDFTIMDIDPNDASVLDTTTIDIVENNVVDEEINFVHTEKQLQKRIYTTPDANGQYRPDNLVSKVKIVRIMELGKVTTNHKFERKDKKKQIKKVYDNERKDLLAKALRFANHHISTGGVSIQQAEKYDKTLDDAKSFSVPNNTYFVKGWARRNANKHKDGGLYGRKYILNYKNEIESFFRKGKTNSSDKMNPAQMRETLRSMYPKRFRIPSETEIKQEISKLFQGSKKRDENEDADEINSDVDDIDVNNSTIEQRSWEAILEQFLKDNFNLKPEEIWRRHVHELIETFKFDQAQLPDKVTVKRKIQSLRAKYKKKAMGDLV